MAASQRRHALRRLAPALAGVSVVATLLLVPSAQAAHEGAVQLGHANTSSTWTQITTTGAGETALYLFGHRALYAVGNPGPGAYLWSYGNEALLATAIWPAIGGTGTATNGVHGVSGNPNASGVLGENVSTGFGVKGTSEGIAVSGQSTGDFGIGVYGEENANGGIGVYGISGASNGIGVYASSSSGTALKAQGPAVLNGNLTVNGSSTFRGRTTFARSGKLTVPAGSSSVTKTAVPLGSASMVLATLQQNVPGVWVRAAVPNPGASSFTVYLNKSAPANVTFAYHVLG